MAGDVGGTALGQSDEAREVVHQRAGPESADPVTPESDVAPGAAPGPVGEYLHLPVLIEHEGTVEIANGERLGVFDGTTGECPMLHPRLTEGKPFAGNRCELEHLPHGH